MVFTEAKMSLGNGYYTALGFITKTTNYKTP